MGLAIILDKGIPDYRESKIWWYVSMVLDKIFESILYENGVPRTTWLVLWPEQLSFYSPLTINARYNLLGVYSMTTCTIIFTATDIN